MTGHRSHRFSPLRALGLLLTTAVLAHVGTALPAQAESFQIRVVTPTPQGYQKPTATPSGNRREQPTPTPTGARRGQPTATSLPTAAPTATQVPTATPDPRLDARLPSGVTVGEAYAEARRQAPAETPVPEISPTSTATPDEEIERRRRALELGAARLDPAPELSSFWQELKFRELLQRSASSAGADTPLVVALLQVEAETEGLPLTGITGLGRYRQQSLQPGDDPGDQETLVLRAAEQIRVLQERWHVPELVAAAYFGALDESGRVTEESAGTLPGVEYVQRFRSARKRYVDGYGALPGWLVSPFGEIPLTSRMIRFGFLGDYGEELAFEVRGEEGVAQYGTIHLGVDLQIPGRPDGGRGAPVVAPFDGRVIRTADPIGGPFGIWLESPRLDLRARLMHMDGLVAGIETGVWVSAGQQLGVLGAQGTEGFPHLHLAFERLSSGGRINPALFYRVGDPSDPATASGRWPFDLTMGWSAAGARWYSTRLVPEATSGIAPSISRLVPFELPAY